MTLTHYLILDTESSVCLTRRRRVLVSLAYEIFDGGRAAVPHGSAPMPIREAGSSLPAHGIPIPVPCVF